jgi:hypothetical protein
MIPLSIMLSRIRVRFAGAVIRLGYHILEAEERRWGLRP